MDIEKILNKRSNAVVTDGGGVETPVKPTSSQLDNGEIAVNYHKGTERLFIKNDNEEVVEFVSKDEVDKKLDIDSTGPTSNTNGSTVISTSENGHKVSYNDDEIENQGYTIRFKKGNTPNLFLGAGDVSSDHLSVHRNQQSGISAFTKALAYVDDIPSVTPQVQSDWNETNTTSKAYIKNKPTFNTGVTSVGLSMPSTYFTVDSSPITTSGTLTVSLKTGYTIPTTALLNSFVKCVTETVSITEDTLYDAGTITDQKHVFFVNSTTDSDFVVTIDNSSSSFKTPDGHVLQLTVPADGYAECNFINVNGTIFVRGI